MKYYPISFVFQLIKPIVNMFAKPIWYDTKPFSSSPDIQSLKKIFQKDSSDNFYHWVVSS